MGAAHTNKNEGPARAPSSAFRPAQDPAPSPPLPLPLHAAPRALPAPWPYRIGAPFRRLAPQPPLTLALPFSTPKPDKSVRKH